MYAQSSHVYLKNLIRAHSSLRLLCCTCFQEIQREKKYILLQSNLLLAYPHPASAFIPVVVYFDRSIIYFFIQGLVWFGWCNNYQVGECFISKHGRMLCKQRMRKLCLVSKALVFLYWKQGPFVWMSSLFKDYHSPLL